MPASSNISFWDGFFLMLIFIPIAMCWAFALVDLIRRKDLSGWVVALWLIAIIIFPLFGTLFYFIFRPITKQDLEMQAAYETEIEFEKTAKEVDKLHKLADLRDKGVISEEEFEKKKAKLVRE